MHAAQTIRAAVEAVSQIRFASTKDPALGLAVNAVKRFQARRFAGTYKDLLQSPRYQGASRFFLEQIYDDKDHSARDTQFARIAGALQSVFPAQVTDVAVSLAQLHRLTEELDHAMGQAWSATAAAGQVSPALRYILAWRQVGRQPDRVAQLEAVLVIGDQLERLARKPALHVMLKMMRRPAAAAGLSSLQDFLEAGFSAFSAMVRQGDTARQFLITVKQRESDLMARLFSDDPGATERELLRVLGAD